MDRKDASKMFVNAKWCVKKPEPGKTRQNTEDKIQNTEDKRRKTKKERKKENKVNKNNKKKII